MGKNKSFAPRAVKPPTKFEMHLKHIKKDKDTKKAIEATQPNKKSGIFKDRRKAKALSKKGEQFIAQKKSLFNLDSENEDIEMNVKEDFDEPSFSEDNEMGDDDDNIETKEMMESINFGGFENKDPTKMKSRQEIYKEIIKKSKLAKHLRQKQNEENFELREDLDDRFDGIREILEFRGKGEKRVADTDYITLAEEIANDSKAEPTVETKKSEKALERRKKRKAKMESDEEKDEDEDYGNDEELDKTRKSQKNSRKRILTPELKTMLKLNEFSESLQKFNDHHEEEEMEEVSSSEEEDDDDEDDDMIDLEDEEESEDIEEKDDDSNYSNEQEF